MFRASLGEAHPKIRFTKPFSLKKRKKERKKPQVHLNHLKIAVKKTYIIQGNSSREWLIFNNQPTKTKNKKQKQQKPTKPSK